MLKTKWVVVIIAILTKFVGSIAALEPCYGKDGGNVTRVYTRQGEIHVLERRLKTVLKNMACYYGADLAALRKHYGEAFGCSYDVPLAFSGDLVLVPLKMRKPMTDKDGATGFVNVFAVNRVVEVEEDYYKSCLELEGGHELPLLFSVETAEKRLKMGRLAGKYYCYLRKEYKDQGGAFIALETDHDDTIDKLLITMGRLFQELLAHKKMMN